jgi:hypothetical protein
MKADQQLDKAARVAAERDNAYLAEHRVSKGFQFDPGFKVKAFPGLLYCQLIRESGGARKVISCWRNRDSYKAEAEPFTAALGDARALTEGFHCAFRGSSIPPWKRVSILSVILFITAVVGFRKMMGDEWNDWFEPSELEISSEEQDTLRTVVNDPLGVQLHFRNRSLSTLAVLKEVHCFLDDGKTNWQVFANKQQIPVPKGEKTSQKFSITAPRPGRYTLRAEASGKTGRLRSTRINTNSFNLDVWADIEFKSAKILGFSSNKCQIAVDLFAGRASTNQVRCEASLTEYDTTCFEMVGPTTMEPDRYCDAASKQAEIDWQARPMSAFQVQPFVLVLHSESSKAAPEWTNLVRRIDFQVAR